MPPKTQRNYILGSCVSSALAVLITVISLSTEFWAVSDALVDGGTTGQAKVSYGLFKGVYDRTVGQSALYEITMTCSTAANKCALMCGSTSESRERELELLLADDNANWSNINQQCASITRNIPAANSKRILRQITKADERTFINCGLYGSTLFFLVAGMVCGFLATGLSVWNAIANPIHYICNVMGVIIFNIAACSCLLMVMVLWGAQFNVSIADNIGVFETTTGEFNTTNPSLGYSYWINMASMLLYMTSVGLLYYRKYVVERENIINNVEPISNKNDGSLIIF